MKKLNLLFLSLTFLLVTNSQLFAQWEAIENEWDNEIREIFTVDGYLFVNTSDDDLNNAQLFISTDNGDTFSNISDSMPDTLGLVRDITSHKGEIFLAANSSIYASSDLGSTWRKINHEVDFGGSPYSFFIISIESDGEVLYAGTNKWIGSAYVLKSADNGNSWEIVHSSTVDIDQIEASDSYIYFKVGDYSIFRSELNGEDWNEIYRATYGGTLSGISGDFAADTEGETIMVLEENDTLMISSDYGENFSASDEIVGNLIFKVAFGEGTFFVHGNPQFNASFENGLMYRNQSTNYEWMSLSNDMYKENTRKMVTNGQYLFIQYGDTLITRTDLSNFGITTDIENESDELPSAFSLSQNYPNPFNPSTTISFSVPMQSNVSLKVYDILGKEVAELVNSEKSAGSYKVEFDASKLSSGIYFYTLNAGNFNQTRKMLLVK